MAGDFISLNFQGIVLNFMEMLFVFFSEKVAFPSCVLETTLEWVNWKFTL